MARIGEPEREFIVPEEEDPMPAQPPAEAPAEPEPVLVPA